MRTAQSRHVMVTDGTRAAGPVDGGGEWEK